MPEGTAWDNPPIGEALADQPVPTKKKRGWRKAKAPAAAVAAAGMAGVAGSAAGLADAPAESTESITGQPVTATAAPPVTNAKESTGGVDAPGPAETVAPEVGDRGPDAPATTADDEAGPQPRHTSRLFVLGVVLAVVIGGIAYLVVHGTSPSPKPAATPVSPPPSTPSDVALVASVNLRLGDLPAGWTQGSPSAPLLRLPVANSTVEAQATQTLASCLGIQPTTAAALFAGGSLPGQTSVAESPVFVDSADPGIQMRSTTTAVGTPAEAQSIAAPFENPNFAACYGQFERTVVAATVPGATAAVQVVTLAQPPGAKSFGFITTVTSPQGTQVFGQAVMVGGRLVTDLMPATNGPAIPTADFVPAYDAVSARVSTNVEK
jgi:hypothetical protein